jgi:GT2 family glycosyltransferase
VSAARNVGWRAARARMVMFLGDDILADRDLLQEHLRWHKRHPDERVGVLGHVRWARELELTAFMRWLEHGTQFDYHTIQGSEAGWGHFYTSNISVKRPLLERAGGFDEEHFPFLYEDLDLGYRLSGLGLRLLYNRRARAAHLHQTDLEEWRGRMAATAPAERRWVRLHPHLRPYFYERFSAAAARPTARGRTGRYLLRWVPTWMPWLGRRVWGNATIYYRQQLAPAFLQAWQDADAP